MVRLGLFQYYNKDQPRVHYSRDPNPMANTYPLETYIETYESALLDGRRITPTSRSTRNSAGSAIIQARIANKARAGEIRSIFIHRQKGVHNSSRTLLAAIEWMELSGYTPLGTPKFLWDD